MRASLEVADIFRSAGPAYRSSHAGHLSLHQLKVMSAIEHCRTAVMGGHVAACTDCGHWRVSAATIRSEHMGRHNGFLVQPSGPKNALGLVKFDMKDDQAIYLHDTSDHTLFARVQRHLSHGCVRVRDALGFAQGLAQQEGILPQWQQARQSGKEAFVTLPQPIPVRLLYWNAFVDQNGQIAFRTDPYGWNPPIAKALGFAPQVSAKPKPTDIDLGP